MKNLRHYIGFLLITYGQLGWSQPTICQQHKCVAIVDGGSTGSRLYIYAFDLNQNNFPKYVDVVYSAKINPGVATMASPEQVNRYLSQLFEQASVKNMPVTYYITGGGRLLPEGEQQQLLVNIRQWFAEQSDWSLKDVQIINGQDEGIYDWLATNYTLGRLEGNKPLYNIVDIGGASIEIAVSVNNASNYAPQELVDLTINGRQAHLLSKSILGLGGNEVIKRNKDIVSCFSVDYPMSNGASGKGDASLCQAKLDSQLNLGQQITPIIRQAIAQDANAEWFALGAASDLAKNEPFEFSGIFSSQDMLEQTNQKICHVKWQILDNKYPNNPHMPFNCLSGSYIYSLFVNGLKFTPTQVINYAVGDDISWTLGVLLKTYANGSGVRDTARVPGVSINTVISELKKKTASLQ